ncbi:MAG: LysR family transcriptional regulator, partial [Polyangiales bacterium]
MLEGALAHFVAVAEQGSFTEAARALRVSQPSLSVAVRKLEERVGAPLLHRERRGVVLTPAGEILLGHARQASGAIGAALAQIHALGEHPSGEFTLGCHESLGTYLLPGFMARFLKRYPEVRLSLTNANSREVEQAVVARDVDVGLVVNPQRHPDCVVQELFEDRVTFIVAASVRRRHGDSDTDMLARLPLLHVPALRQTQYLLGALGTRGIEPPQQIACSSMELVKSLVLDGVGVGILPYRVATHGVASGRLSPLAGELPAYEDVITLVRRADLPMT